MEVTKETIANAIDKRTATSELMDELSDSIAFCDNGEVLDSIAYWLDDTYFDIDDVHQENFDRILCDLVENDCTSPETLGHLASDWIEANDDINYCTDAYYYFAVKLARNARTPADALRVLYLNRWCEETVPEHPNAPADILSIAAKSESEWVRLAAAKNPKTPIDALDTLVADDDLDVQRAVAENPSVSHRLLPSERARLVESAKSAREDGVSRDDFVEFFDFDEWMLRFTDDPANILGQPFADGELREISDVLSQAWDDSADSLRD